MTRATAAGECKRLALTVYTKQRLWSESAGYCENPACHTPLFPDGVASHIAEMAHIIPAATGGPRGADGAGVTAAERARPTNIVVLCANCHTLVDKSPGDYPAAILHSWKRHRIDDVSRALSAARVATREELREQLEPLLEANALIFQLYGPDDSLSEDRAETWRREAAQSIVPANCKVAALLRQNRHLLTPGEQSITDQFFLHADQFMRRHLFGDSTLGMTKFPEGMDKIGADADDLE